ncbi:MAG: hypothetical protein KIS79_15340 [Burkholderiales bacterium]|nr:hypothetical protein [Burkholderiales bacterium]
MEKEIIVALGSSIASLLVAALALWQSSRTTRRQAATQKAVAALQAGSEAAKPVLASVSSAWADVQKIKHALDICLAAGRKDDDAAIEILDGAVDSLVAGYEQRGVDLPEYLKAVWHEAKNHGISLRASVRLQLRDLAEEGCLPETTRVWMLDARSNLSRLQSGLEEGCEQFRKDAIDGVTDLLQRAERHATDTKKPT